MLSQTLEYAFRAVVFLADNASSDGSLEYVRTHFPEVKIQALKALKEMV